MTAVRRKTFLRRSPSSELGRSTSETVIDYGAMTSDELVDHFIDAGGLAHFINVQQAGLPRGDWDWRVIARNLRAFTRGRLTFSPEYLSSLYEMQIERQER